MNMKIYVYAGAFFFPVSVAMIYSEASGNMITFMGAITEKTCAINVSDNGMKYTCFRNGQERTRTFDLAKVRVIEPVKLSKNVYAKCMDSIEDKCTHSIILTNYT